MKSLCLAVNSIWIADARRVQSRSLNWRFFMLDLAFIALGAGTLIALALYAAALERL
jgi:hypothetical protein